MINIVFARNFVRKMKLNMDIDVNIMNSKGIIIASASPERVGDFHQCAYTIIQNNIPIQVTEKPTSDMIGVTRPGVNMLLSRDDEILGVIGVSGKPAEIYQIAQMIKLTFETMYEYEYRNKFGKKSRDRLWNFSNVLLSETPADDYSIHSLAEKLNYSDNLARIPIYIRFYSEHREYIVQQFIESYPSLSIYKLQDITLPVVKGVVLMKTLDSDNPIYSINSYTRMCIETITNEIRSRVSDDPLLRIKYFVGMVQTDFSSYHEMYNQLLWLAESQKSSMETICCLSSHLTEFIVSQCSRKTLVPLLDYCCGMIRANLNTDIFLETVQSLIASNMKLQDAADRLHLHKNSITARLNKIKKLLDINPLSSRSDYVLLVCIYEYLTDHERI